MAVLRAKLRVPLPRRELVARPRLLQQLPQAASTMPPLVLVAAPAGCGKSTLLAQWLGTFTSDGPDVAWLSLDATDAEAPRFLRHLIAAVQVVRPEIGATLGIPSADAEATVLGMLDDLDAVTGRLVIVLDDFHVVADAGVHETVRMLIDNLPPGITVVISSREDPPLPLARMRARGEVVEVRAADLRFTLDEAEGMLNRVMRAELPDTAVQAIEQRTEGWATGLQLAALAAQAHRGAGDIDAFVDEFTGSHRYVLDYLLEEVLGSVSAEVRAFLLDTAVLDEFTASLCDAVTGRDDSAQTLDALERSGLFLIALDDRREWFRYHHLFSTALRAQRLATDVQRVRTLNERAARWLGENDLPVDALPHAMGADAPQLAAELLELAIADLRRTRQDAVIRQWVRTLPDAVLRTRPLLAMSAGWERLAAGDIDGVGAWLDLAEQAVSAPAGAALLHSSRALAAARETELSAVPAMIEVYRATITQAHGDTAGTRTHAERALARTASDQHAARAAALGYLGLAAWAEGDLAVATDAFSGTIRSLRAAGDLTDALGATVVLADMWQSRGRPDEALRLLRAALAEADTLQGGLRGALATRGDLHVGVAALCAERGAIEEAEEHLLAARELSDAASLPENRHRRHVVTAAMLRARGDLDGALAALDAAEVLFLPGYLPDLQPLHARRARLLIAQGRLDDAEVWARQHPSGEASEYGLLTLVRLRIAQQRGVDALALLDGALATHSARTGVGEPIEVRMLRALALESLGDGDAASDEMAAAVRASTGLGYARLFLNEGPAMHGILRRLAASLSDAAPEARRLLALAEVPAAPATTLDDPLSARELEVLRLLAGDLTGPEIAAHLYVTLNTLRTHTKHIYLKLGVGTRRAAVRQAQESGLI